MTRPTPPGASALDEADLALLDALHLCPRASFAQLGAGLGVDETTVARRWRTLVADGLAWVSSAPGPAAPVVWAVYEAECVPGQLDAVAAGLAARGPVASVHVLAGPWSIYALLVCASPAALARLVGELGATPGVVRARTAVVLTPHRVVGWHLDALEPAQRANVTAPEAAASRAPVVFGAGDRDLLHALQDDGRASYREVADVLGRSPDAVRRRMQALVAAGHLVLRTDFARVHAGWSVHVRLWVRVPDEQAAAAGSALAALPEVRVCLAVLGAENLMVTAQLHGLGAVPGLLATIGTIGTVVERTLVLRSEKSWGRLLDAQGRARGVVPVDPWW